MLSSKRVIIGIVIVFCIRFAVSVGVCEEPTGVEEYRQEYLKVSQMISDALLEAHREKDANKMRQKFVTSLEQIIQSYPKSEAIPRAYFMLTACYEKPGEEEKKLDYVKKGLAAHERIVQRIGNESIDGSIYYFGGRLYQTLGNDDKALEQYRRLVDGNYDEANKSSARFAMCFL